MPRRPGRGPADSVSIDARPELGGVAAPGLRVLCRRSWRRDRPPARRSPAHDLVGQQHAAHLRVLVLALVDDGLRGDKQRRGSRGAPAAEASRPAGVGRRGRRRGPPSHPPGRVTTAGPGRGGFRACAKGPLAPEEAAAPAGERPAGAGRGGGRERGRAGTDPGAPVPPLPAPPRRVLGPLSTPSSNPRAARGRAELQRRAEPPPGRQSVRGAGLRPPCPACAPRSSPAACSGPPLKPAPGGPAARVQQPPEAAPGPGLQRSRRECSGPGPPGPHGHVLLARMIFGKKVLMANLVFILKLLTMIFLG